MVPARPPTSTKEYEALEPREGETYRDALARVGEDYFLGEFPAEDAPENGRTKGRHKKLPNECAAVLGLRVQGFDNHEIATKLGISSQKLRARLAQIRKITGWSDLNDRIQHIAAPQAVDNLVKHLDHEGTAKAVKNGQHAVTLKTLQGIGMLRSHAAVKHESTSTNTNVLRVEFVIPDAPAGAGTIAGVLATPRYARAVIDGETT